MKKLLIVLGAPLWIPLLIAAFAVALALYVTLWAVIVSLWAVTLAAAASAVWGIVAGAGTVYHLGGFLGLAYVGAGLASAGVAALFFLGCTEMTRGTAILTKNLGSRLVSSC